MTSVAIHLTDAGAHVNSRGIPWSGASSRSTLDIRRAPTGTDADLVPIAVPNTEDDFTLAAEGARPSDDAFSAIVESLLAEAGRGTSVDSVALTHPSHWGSIRKDLFRTVTARLVPDVVLVPLAVVVATEAATEVSSESYHCVVVEDGDIGAVATYVECALGECTILACEIDTFDEDVTELMVRVANGRQVDAVLTCTTENEPESELRRKASEQFGSTTVVRRVSASDVAASLDRGWGHSDVEIRSERPSPRAQWLTSSGQSAESGRRPVLFAAAAGAVVLAVCAAAVVVYATSPSDTTAVAETPARTPSSLQTPSTTNTSPPTSAASTESRPAESLGRLRVDVPVGWESAKPSTGTSAARDRFELRPVNGDPLRIVLVQKDIRDGAGYDDVAASLEQQIEARNTPEMFGELERDVVFGGRPGIAYSEFPDQRSQVDWHVLIEQSTQVSVGCQFDRAHRADIDKPCDQVIRSLEVVE